MLVVIFSEFLSHLIQKLHLAADERSHTYECFD